MSEDNIEVEEKVNTLLNPKEVASSSELPVEELELLLRVATELLHSSGEDNLLVTTFLRALIALRKSKSS